MKILLTILLSLPVALMAQPTLPSTIAARIDGRFFVGTMTLKEYDTTKGVIVYYDDSLKIHADSALLVRKSDKLTGSIHTTQLIQYWQYLKMILIVNSREIPRKNQIKFNTL